MHQINKSIKTKYVYIKGKDKTKKTKERGEKQEREKD